ncbi:MAG: LysE family translocator [Parvibaculaceae bacterium]
MDWQLIAPFLTAILLLLVTPGPVVAVVVHNTLRNGAAAGVVTALGVEIGEVLVLSTVFAGLILSHELLPLLFRWISLAGIAYLVWMAITIVRSPRPDAREAVVARPSRPVLDGLTIAFSNPATFVFYTAFFPQFVSPQHALFPQLMTLGVIYLVASLVFDIACVVAAARLRSSTGRGDVRFVRLAELGSAAVYLCVAVFALIGFASLPA